MLTFFTTTSFKEIKKKKLINLIAIIPNHLNKITGESEYKVGINGDKYGKYIYTYNEILT